MTVYAQQSYKVPTPNPVPRFLADGTYIFSESDRHGSTEYAATVHSSTLVAFYINGVGAPTSRLPEIQARVFQRVVGHVVRGTGLALL
ncbi:hypothetical protein [Deinococcus pimensis]|uniref:hypothetical protein n=1 Tax=Deinococcus pimensis TaxID=309888 RepID=UPI00048582E2|nr:hypothetical protein [Deinococcus pimensis]